MMDDGTSVAKFSTSRTAPRDGVVERINCVEVIHVTDHHRFDVGEEPDDVQWRVGKRHRVCLSDRVASLQ